MEAQEQNMKRAQDGLTEPYPCPSHRFKFIWVFLQDRSTEHSETPKDYKAQA